MDERTIIEQLLILLEQHHVAIRSEPMGGRGGGLCKLKNHTVFFVDSEAPAIDTAILCARAVNEIVDLEAVYVVPQIRDFIEKFGHEVDLSPPQA